MSVREFVKANDAPRWMRYTAHLPCCWAKQITRFVMWMEFHKTFIVPKDDEPDREDPQRPTPNPPDREKP